MKKYFLYVLKLEQGKYYVGVTSKQPIERFQEHQNGFYAAEWTKIHKPIKIEQTLDLGITTYEKAEEVENVVTRKYVKKYGIDNVRGGNLTYRGKLVKRIGYYWRVEEWQDMVLIAIVAAYLFLSIVYIATDVIAVHHYFGL